MNSSVVGSTGMYGIGEVRHTGPLDNMAWGRWGIGHHGRKATTTKTDYCSARTSALCCRTQGRLQERTAHRGHWYLEAHVVQISHIGTGLAAAAGGEGGAVEAGVVEDTSIIPKITRGKKK